MQLFTGGKFQAFGPLGILPGALLYTYAAGTLTPLATYGNQAGTSTNTNPVVCNTFGQADVWLGSAAYRVILKDATGATIYDVDNIATFEGLLASIQLRLSSTISIKDSPYLATGTGDETSKIQAAIAALQPGQELLIPDGTYSYTALSFSNKTDFNLTVRGKLLNIGTKPGATNVDTRSTTDGLQCIKFDTCSRFKIQGSGSIQNGYRQALFFSSCTDFDVSLDCRGNNSNDNTSGIYVRYSQRFSFNRMTIDGVTLNPGNNSTEVYNSWGNNVQIWDCTDFTFDGVISRGAGMNGIYPASNCFDFKIVNCTLEYNAGSGVQMAWSSFGVFPQRFIVANNTFRYNQADGLDINNTSGSNVDIYAAIVGNVHAFNGFINSNPANAAGVDGSGIGTYINVNRWAASNNQVYECASYGAYVSNCNNWSIAEGAVLKANAGGVNGGIYLSGGTSGRLTGIDVKVPSTVNALTTTSMNDVVIRDNSFDGRLSFANGSYPGCKFAENRCTAYVQTLVQFDWLDNNLTAANAAQNGLYLVNPKLKVQRNTVTATAIAIVNPSVNYTDISGNQATSTGASAQGIYVNASTGVNVYGNDGVSVGSSGIHLDAACNLCVLANNRGTSSTGNALRVESTCTLTQKFGNISVSGTTSYAGTYGVNS